MKKITLSVVLFVFLVSLAGLFIGALISPLFIPENPGMIGGALVLYYSVIGMAIGFITGLIIWRFFNANHLKFINWVLGIGCLGVVLWLTYRYNTRTKASGEIRSEVTEIPKPTTPAPSLPVSPDPAMEDAVAIGVGMGKPIMESDYIIYFYPDSEVSRPSDSLIFRDGPYGLEVDESSSHIAPEHMKLDYQICYFLVKSVADNRFQVVIDVKTGRNAWVKQEQMDLMTWPMFLTSVHSVESADWQNNPVRISPDDSADSVDLKGGGHFLEAKSRSGDWLNVIIFDEDYQQQGRGWIRWRKDGELVLTYNLLS